MLLHHPCMSWGCFWPREVEGFNLPPWTGQLAGAPAQEWEVLDLSPDTWCPQMRDACYEVLISAPIKRILCNWERRGKCATAEIYLEFVIFCFSRVLLCLKRALRIANAAQQMANVTRGSSGSATLFVEILNK